MSDQTAALRATLRRLALPIYVPWFGVAFGTAMLLPILPVYLTDLGLSFTSATVVLAATGVGATASGLPLGAALSRVGERALLVASILLSASRLANSASHSMRRRSLAASLSPRTRRPGRWRARGSSRGATARASSSSPHGRR